MPQVGQKPENLTELIQMLTSIVGAFIPVAVGFCVVAFAWGLMTVLMDTDNADKRKEGSKRMIWSVLALFVVLSLGGIIEILKATLLGEQ
ncbi:MAG: ion transporter [Patescibacteria group bacterium]